MLNVNLNADAISLLANAVFTLTCGVAIFLLVYIKKLQQHFTYFCWATGFIFYGIRLFFVFFLGYENIVVSLAFGLPSYLFFVMGIWGLTGKKWLLYLLSIITIPFAIALFIGLPIYDFLVLLFYGLMTVGVLVNRNIFGRSMDKLLIGWFLLLLVNLILGTSWLANSFAILAKAVLLFGVFDEEFAIKMMKAREELSSHDYPIDTGSLKKEGGIKLVIPKMNGNKLPVKSVSESINAHLEENIKRHVETNLLIMQNIVPYNVLRSYAWKNQELVHIFVFSESKPKNEEFTTFKFDLTEVGSVLTEVTRKYSTGKACGEIIMVDLSILIHTFGEKPVYNFLLNKMGDLRLSATSLFCFFNVETHEKTIESLFKSISDEIVQF